MGAVGKDLLEHGARGPRAEATTNLCFSAFSATSSQKVQEVLEREEEEKSFIRS